MYYIFEITVFFCERKILINYKIYCIDLEIKNVPMNEYLFVMDI